MSLLLKTVIVDDEPLARQGISNYIMRHESLSLAGAYGSPKEFGQAWSATLPDLLLLDIEMPGMTGIEYLQQAKSRIPTVFITAYPQFALDGYQLDVLDYLLKPVTYEKFCRAIAKVLDYTQRSEQDARNLWVKSGNTLEKIKIEDILFVRSLQNYIQIVTFGEKYTILMPLKSILQELPDADFMQCHKSYIVRLDSVSRMEGHVLYVGNEKIPISRKLRSEVSEKLTGGNLL